MATPPPASGRGIAAKATRLDPRSLRALTLWQPWAWALFHGKPIENRSWRPPAALVGSRLALHGGKTYDAEGDAFVRGLLGLDRLPAEARWQGILGLATLDRVVTRAAGEASGEADPVLRSPWYFGAVGWVLRDLLEFPEPIPCKGAMGLWTVPERVVERILTLERQAASGR